MSRKLYTFLVRPGIYYLLVIIRFLSAHHVLYIARMLCIPDTSRHSPPVSRSRSLLSLHHVPSRDRAWVCEHFCLVHSLFWHVSNHAGRLAFSGSLRGLYQYV